MTTPPHSAYAEAVRRAVEDHDEWDSPHYFMTLHWDAEQQLLAPRTVVCIMPDISPEKYHTIMARAAWKQRTEYPSDPPAYGYLLQFEGFTVEAPSQGADLDEQRRYDADRRNRTFHRRADAVETCIAMCAGIHGNTWVAVKRRGHPGIEECTYRPGHAPVGQFFASLLGIAYATGMLDHGLPRPQSQYN